MTLYFNENDEVVDEEEALRDKRHKYHTVVVDLGSDDYISGTNILTKDLFCSDKNTENAQIFVENYEKTKAKHQAKMMEPELFQSSDSNNSASHIEVMDKNGDGVVLMDLNPKKFEKPKDHLFFDFFSAYAKSFISEKHSTSSEVNNRHPRNMSLQKRNIKGVQCE